MTQIEFSHYSPPMPSGRKELIFPYPPQPPQSDSFKQKSTWIFNKEALAGLSLADQILFEQFGQGPQMAVPYAAIHHPFEMQAAAQPEGTAAHHLEESISYRELNRQANRLARRLAELGVTNGDTVALFVQRSIPMLIGLLASLKVGAAYVPQDVGVVPKKQLQHIIEAADSRVILTLSAFRDRVPVPAGHACLAIDEIMDEPLEKPAAYDGPFLADREVEKDDRCFILFTSGTTGNPNGVQVTHGNVGNILLTKPGNLGMRPGLRVAQILSISFDMAAWEILGALAHGSTLVIRGKAFQPIVESVDVIIATPTILGSLDADRCHQVKTVAVAGEPCPRPLADKWSSFCRFYNSCGPTETTIINTAQHYQPIMERLTIGKPTPNNSVYVLDENRQPLPIGEIGEMWAGGDCVTAGYLKNPDLNAERYVDDPFLGGGRKMFRTRDLGRWTPDGDLEHYGRTDDQVKVRGFRVELDSVSRVIESTPSCTKAVTLKLDSRHLVAFANPAAVDVEAAKKAIEKNLPYYCMPLFILPMDSFPMTSRGKVDKRTLMKMAINHQAQMEQLPAVEEAAS